MFCTCISNERRIEPTYNSIFRLKQIDNWHMIVLVCMIAAHDPQNVHNSNESGLTRILVSECRDGLPKWAFLVRSRFKLRCLNASRAHIGPKILCMRQYIQWRQPKSLNCLRCVVHDTPGWHALPLATSYLAGAVEEAHWLPHGFVEVEYWVVLMGNSKHLRNFNNNCWASFSAQKI